MMLKTERILPWVIGLGSIFSGSNNILSNDIYTVSTHIQYVCALLM